MSELKIVPFTNDFGQVINPGEDIVYAGTSWKSTHFNKGKFGGVYYKDVTRSVPKKNEDGTYVLNDRGYRVYDYVKSNEPVAVRVNEVPDKRWSREKKEMVDVMRCAILPLMRVFRLDTSVKELTGSRF